MRSALAEGAHLQNGVLMAPKCPAACPLPSSPPGSSLSGKEVQAEPASCRLRLEVGAVDPHAVQDHGELAGERDLGALRTTGAATRMAHAFNGNQRATRVIITCAASNSATRARASPALVMAPRRSVSPDW